MQVLYGVGALSFCGAAIPGCEVDFHPAQPMQSATSRA